MSQSGYRGRRAWAATTVALSVVVALASCTNSDDEPSMQSPARQPRTLADIMSCENYATGQVAPDVLTGEQFLAGIHEADLQAASALIQPADHPEPGELIPFAEWDREQVIAWEKFISRDQDAFAQLLKVAYERMIAEVTPEEFRAAVHERAAERVLRFFYPDGHPRAGEFIPADEWDYPQQSAWIHYLVTRPNDLGCPYGAERRPDEPLLDRD